MGRRTRKMGPRPADFDEVGIRQSPTFAKWMNLEDGESLRYACRDFVKGAQDEEERLMRRIMIARRNNIKDYKIVKDMREAKLQQEEKDEETNVDAEDDTKKKPPKKKKKKPKMNKPKRARRRSDAEIKAEMDMSVVEANPSYQKWLTLKEGETLKYGYEFTKDKKGHDWALKKIIWRRTQYRKQYRPPPKSKSKGEDDIKKPAAVKKLNATMGDKAVAAMDDEMMKPEEEDPYQKIANAALKDAEKEVQAALKDAGEDSYGDAVVKAALGEDVEAGALTMDTDEEEGNEKSPKKQKIMQVARV